MNTDKPVKLPEKIQYLKQKIDQLHWQSSRTDDFIFRLKFQQYIDTSIQSIIAIKKNDNNHNKNNQLITTTIDDKYLSGKIYSIETQKLELQKKIAQYQNAQISSKQRNLQTDNLKIKLQNVQLQMQLLKKKHDDDQNKLSKKYSQLQQKNKFYQKQLEKVVKLNQRQDQQINKVKEERARAEKKQFQIREKYDKQMGKLEHFNDKNPKYLDRSSEGLRCTKMFINISKQKPGNQKKLFTVKLPAIVQVNKIVYGIMVGAEQSNHEIKYFDKLQLFEKQATEIYHQKDKLIFKYPKRKGNNQTILHQYKVNKPEIVIMLYGKGDSIYIHQ